MASNIKLPLLVLLVSLTSLLALFVTPSTSARLTTDHSKIQHPKGGFRVNLKHVDSGKNLTKFERIQYGIHRSKNRLQRLKRGMNLASETDIDAPVVAGDGEFLMSLAIGTPPETFSAIMDTGSDLIWTQCMPCTKCFNQSTPIFDPKKSSSFSKLPCSSTLCSALPQSTCTNGCEYVYTYGDYSSTQGLLASETFTFDDKVSIKNVAFGCGDDNNGEGFVQGAGLVGLGRGPLSLVSQSKEPKFSYCLNSIDDKKTSALIMGSMASRMINRTAIGKTTKSTPLLKNPLQSTFYYLSLEGITVGEKRLPIDKSTFSLKEDGSGGLIIDSGTTITYLEESAFDQVAEEFMSKIDLPVDTSGSAGLDLCFQTSGSKEIEVPKLVFHFEGGVDLDLPGENYMIGDESMGVLCLAMSSSNGMSIFGNIQQQNTMVYHDLDNESITFIPTNCDTI